MKKRQNPMFSGWVYSFTAFNTMSPIFTMNFPPTCLSVKYATSCGIQNQTQALPSVTDPSQDFSPYSHGRTRIITSYTDFRHGQGTSWPMRIKKYDKSRDLKSDYALELTFSCCFDLVFSNYVKKPRLPCYTLEACPCCSHHPLRNVGEPIYK